MNTTVWIEVKHLFLEPLPLRLVLDFYNVSEFPRAHYTPASTDREPESSMRRKSLQW